MNPVIPPKKNRLVQRKYDKDLYKIRHLVENAFLHLKKMEILLLQDMLRTQSLSWQ